MLNVDFKDRDGNWVLRWGHEGAFMQTRLGALHNNVTQRAKVGGSYQKRFPTYTGVGLSPTFQDPNAFCDWVVKQHGWGLGWSIDKDLLGNKAYSEDVCVFLPQAINVAIIRRGNSNGARYKASREAQVKMLAEAHRSELDPRAYNALLNWKR